MFENIKHKTAEFIVKKKYLRKQSSNINFNNFISSSSDFLIILPGPIEDFENSIEVVRYLSIHKKNVSVFLAENREKNIPEIPNLKKLFFNENELSKLGLPKNSLTERLKKDTYDIVIDLSRGDDLFSSTITNIPLSSYRVGFKKKNSDIYYNFQIPSKINSENSYRFLLNSFEMF